jgi:hypothetical protein
MKGDTANPATIAISRRDRSQKLMRERSIATEPVDPYAGSIEYPPVSADAGTISESEIPTKSIKRI